MDHHPAEYRILALYRFVPIVSPPTTNNEGSDASKSKQEEEEVEWDEASLMAHPERHPTLLKLQSELRSTLRRYDVKGTLLIAPEGVNGTICYPHYSAEKDAVMASSSPDGGDDDPVAAYLKNHPLFGGPELRTRLSVWKDNKEDNNSESESASNGGTSQAPPAAQQAFHRLKIKIKSEIVTLGLGRPLIDRTPAPQEPDNALMRNESNQLANPLSTKGQYLNPNQWDEACRNPNILVIDTRNTYEIEIGTFENAIDPRTENFSEFPDYLEKLAEEYDWSSGGNSSSKNNGDRCADHGSCDNEMRNNDAKRMKNDSDNTTAETKVIQQNETNKQKRKPPPDGIAMVCTGGIRCEKATSFAIQSKLFPNVPIYHLEGGILAYLDNVSKRGDSDGGDTNQMKDGEDGDLRQKQPMIYNDESASNVSERTLRQSSTSTSKSTFRGECFVFDKRVALTEGLKPSTNYTSCHGCRGPLEHRLLLQEVPNKSNNNNNDAEVVGYDTNNNGVAKEEALAILKRYHELTEGISHNLPSLQFDVKTQKHYLPGLTCPRCHELTTRESLERFAQRERQMEICTREGKPLFRDNGQS